MFTPDRIRSIQHTQFQFHILRDLNQVMSLHRKVEKKLIQSAIISITSQMTTLKLQDPQIFQITSGIQDIAVPQYFFFSIWKQRDCSEKFYSLTPFYIYVKVVNCTDFRPENKAITKMNRKESTEQAHSMVSQSFSSFLASIFPILLFHVFCL